MTPVDRFRAQALGLGSATLYEAAGRVGALPHQIKPIRDSWRLAGAAYTVRCDVGDNLAVHRAVAEAPGGAILVVAANGDPAGYWGEVLTVAAQARGLGGLVIDGGVRDTVRIEELGWLTWARAVAIAGCDKKQPGEIGGVVTISDVEARTGDFVVADRDGVVVIPAARAAEVLATGAARASRESDLFERLRAGELTLDLLGLR